MYFKVYVVEQYDTQRPQHITMESSHMNTVVTYRHVRIALNITVTYSVYKFMGISMQTVVVVFKRSFKLEN